MDFTFKNIATNLWLFCFIALMTFIGWTFQFNFGVIPRSTEGIIGIIGHPFFHGNFAHLASNSPPLLILGSLMALRSKNFLFGVVFITICSGILVWTLGRSAEHIGASGLIFGMFGYLLSLPFFAHQSIWKKLISFVFSIVVFSLYFYLIFSLFTFERGVSWEGHFFGFLSGVLFAKLDASHGK